MISEICINLDGTVDCFDYDGCRVSHLSGDWTILHHLYNCFTAEHPAQTVLDNDRCERATWLVSTPRREEQIQITRSHVKNMLRFIKEPQFK